MLNSHSKLKPHTVRFEPVKSKVEIALLHIFSRTHLFKMLLQTEIEIRQYPFRSHNQSAHSHYV